MALLLASSGCDRRARAVRAELSAAERERFDRGQQLSTRCWACHDLYAENRKIGPHLVGIEGRRAGSLAGFPYSEAMRTSGIVWSPETLRAFVANPSGFLPGTTMVERGAAAGGDLDALIFYLVRVTER